MVITIEQLRALVQDKGTTQLLEDSTYIEVMDLEVNSYKAAAVCCRILAAKYAAKVKVKAGPVAVENQQKFEHFKSLADAYDQSAREGGGGEGAGQLGAGGGAPELTGVSVADMETVREDTDRPESAFRMKIHKNPTGNEETVNG
jgi:hypothetical protein